MGRVAIVTGGSRGIGEAISLRLKDMGFTVVANYAGNDTAAKQFSEANGIVSYKWDVGDYQACVDGCAKVTDEVGPVDVLVNNAGITRDNMLHKMSEAEWADVIRVNLGGCFNMCSAVYPGMRERKWGRIVSIGSVNGQAGQMGQVNYAAAKAGIHGFTKALAQEAARFGVTVNADRTGLHQHRHGRCSARAGAREDRRQDPGGPTRCVPTRSRAGSRSCARTMPASSPDRRCRSTVASTCIEPAPTGKCQCRRRPGRSGPRLLSSRR